MRTAVGHAITCDFTAVAVELINLREGNQDRAAKRPRLASQYSFYVSETQKSELAALVERENVVNLWDPVYKRDMTPLVSR